MKNKFTLLK